MASSTKTPSRPRTTVKSVKKAGGNTRTGKSKVDPGIKYINDFKNARSSPVPQERLDEVRERSIKYREKLLKGNQVLYYRTMDLIRAPYPTRFGFLHAFRSRLTPFMHILNRLFIIQYKDHAGKLRTLLFSPSDYEYNQETPFFKRLATMGGPLSALINPLLAPRMGTVQEQLAKCGLQPEDVDYISYDHLHTQELRNWLGSDDREAYFPNAKLLVMEQEWESAAGLLPPQSDWYCPDGTRGIDPRKIVRLESDTSLGEGLALIRTPGHTEGNHSLVAHTPGGVLVSSENGVSADAYAPLKSRIRSLRKFAETTGWEVIINGNTQEGGLDQYISLVQEKEIAGPCPENPDFYNVVPSSEMTPYWLFPGLRPTHSFGPLEYGEARSGARGTRVK